MRLSRLNLLTAAVALIASVVWFAIGQVWAGIVSTACSLVWLVLAIARLRSPASEPGPARRMARRLSRLLIWS